MRCQCCNANLSDYESCLKHPETLEYLDICNKCLTDIPITPVEPADSDNNSFQDDNPEMFDATDLFEDDDDLY